MSKLFKGEAEIKEHLNDLINGKSSASKIKAACTLCFKYQQEYKLVVYEIEKFIKRVDIGDKLTSLYLLDAICRNSRAQVNNNKDKDIFSNRFAIRLKETVASLQYDSLSQADKLGCTKVFEEWRKRDIFSSDLIPVTALVSTLQREDIPFNNNNDNSNSINSNEYFNQSYMQMQPPVYAPPPPVFVQQPSAFPQQSILHTSRFNVTSNNEPLNTFNDMFNQQVHMQQQQQQMFQPPPTALVPPPVPPPPVPPIAPIPPGSKVDKKTKAAAEKKVKIAPKMCPFKQSDGYKSCPYGEKCRFSHALEWNPTESHLLHQITKEKAERESGANAAADSGKKDDCVHMCKWQFKSLKRPLNDALYDVEAINSFIAESISSDDAAKGLDSERSAKQTKVVRKKYASGNCADIVYSMDVTRVSMSCIDEKLFYSAL